MEHPITIVDIFLREFGAEVETQDSWYKSLAQRVASPNQPANTAGRPAEIILEEIREYWRINVEGPSQASNKGEAIDLMNLDDYDKKSECSSGSRDNRDSLKLERFPGLGEYLNKDELAEFLRCLSDKAEDYGQGFDSSCEILGYDFESTGPEDIYFVPAEYLRILHYIERTGNAPVVITGQPGIGM